MASLDRELLPAAQGVPPCCTGCGKTDTSFATAIYLPAPFLAPRLNVYRPQGIRAKWALWRLDVLPPPLWGGQGWGSRWRLR